MRTANFTKITKFSIFVIFVKFAFSFSPSGDFYLGFLSALRIFAVFVNFLEEFFCFFQSWTYLLNIGKNFDGKCSGEIF